MVVGGWDKNCLPSLNYPAADQKPVTLWPQAHFSNLVAPDALTILLNSLVRCEILTDIMGCLSVLLVQPSAHQINSW